MTDVSHGCGLPASTGWYQLLNKAIEIVTHLSILTNLLTSIEKIAMEVHGALSCSMQGKGRLIILAIES